jgi:PIN domain nuclease of toxin-antitoxin system
VTTVLLDTHVLHWWTSDSSLLSQPAYEAIDAADQLAIASVSWYELAWMAERGRILVPTLVRTWLEQLSREVLTVPTTPAIAAAAVELPRSFPGDPADRVIYATALEQGWSLVTKDGRMLSHPAPRPIAIW